MLKEVEVYIPLHRAAIELPSVQTQAKSRNSMNQLWIWKVSRLQVKGQSVDKKISFDLPDFSSKER